MKTKLVLFIICFLFYNPCSWSQNVGIEIFPPTGNPIIKLLSSSGSDLMWIHSDDPTNIFVGLNAGRVNNASESGLYNSFVGRDAGYSNTTGSFNTSNGFQALYSNTTGNSNTANGNFTLYSNTIGSFNTALGLSALNANTTGMNNTAIGDSALYLTTTGSNNTAIGHGANVTAEISNATAIGAKAFAGSSNSVVIGSINGVNGATANANVGVGTTTPNPKAILEIKSTTQGVLFPMMTTAQRTAITTPPHGLHVFNIEERCLNYYDSIYQVWNCYCDDCKAVIININQNACEVDFYNAYANTSPASKYIINIASGVTISGCNSGDTALTFKNMPLNVVITINNHGTIAGGGGIGGNGAIENDCNPLTYDATPGLKGGHAVATKTSVTVSINNYGIVAGGGGGGGGSSENPNGYGGGGGGGAGIIGGIGGIGGGFWDYGPFGGCFINWGEAEDGLPGQPTVGGVGGAGVNGGAQGGNGGNRGENGLTGIGNNSAPGGLAGKAIGGGSGNSLTNLSGGQSFGAVD